MYYTTISASYQELHKEEQLNKLRIIKENLILKNQKMLDIGCGPCWSTELFDNVVGVDPSFNLLNKDKTVVQGTAENLPFKTSTFDIILSITAVHHFDITKAFAEMKRAAKADAQYIITLLKKSEKKDLIIIKIKENFNVKKTIEEEKDTIFFLTNLTSKV